MRLKMFVEVITNRTNIRNQRNTISVTYNGHTTKVQNNNLSTENVKPECQLDQQKKNQSLVVLTSHDLLSLTNKTNKKNFGLTGLVTL